ncbi:PREDICTED: probable LRR receptor-like serine/threonine-protein kinase At4g26540 [Nicotiana attenuata]|uniref:probable LRR receptor-like serine/threonine-protein kinase At4g26540 n=1 Tax=Nicotiana attenuata TaxID=49451 RepID=UPI00090582F6|nr:PREDICTED: probable LRR receptor-like serine/threonine-protein kinase At4g26540 [Nicotiana attenuata]
MSQIVTTTSRNLVLFSKKWHSWRNSSILLQYVVTSSAIKTETNITTDQLALLSLESQIISDPFELLAKSWSQDTCVCNWIGVTCGSLHHRVTSLNISNMDLTGIIPQYFRNLTFLVSLDLRNNSFCGTLPQEMAHLHRQKFVRLNYSNFSGEIPSWFVFNALEGQIPKNIGNLKNLRGLSFESNNLTGSIRPSFSNASKLETLILSKNFLHGNIPNGIGDLHNLNWLTIETNQLAGSITFPIFNIFTIETIGFPDNGLSGSLPTDLCDHLPILKGLYLSFNNLLGHMPPSLSRCYKLQLLSLSNNEFDGPIHSEIGTLSNLRTLYLGFNRFTGKIP